MDIAPLSWPGPSTTGGIALMRFSYRDQDAMNPHGTDLSVYSLLTWKASDSVNLRSPPSAVQLALGGLGRFGGNIFYAVYTRFGPADFPDRDR